MIDKPRVLLFDDSGDSLYLEFASNGAERAGWQPLPFDNPNYALEEFDTSIKALITALGTKKSWVIDGHPADLLIARSNHLEVPRALLSGHPEAEKWTRADSSDIVIPKTDAVNIPHRVSSWLLDLWEKQR